MRRILMLGALAALPAILAAQQTGQSTGHRGVPGAATTPAAPGAYISTFFDEAAAGTPINGTKPAVDTPASSWVEPTNLWVYQTVGGTLLSSGNASPATIDVGHVNYTVRISLAQSMIGTTIYLKYLDANNALQLNVGNATQIQLYSGVHGSGTLLGTMNLAGTATYANITCAMVGTAVNCKAGVQSISATMPAGNTYQSATKMGFNEYNPNSLAILSMSASPQ